VRLLEAGHNFHLDRTFRRCVWGFMANERPLTIEILALGPGGPLVVDRVTGGTNYFDEAKRIGEHLLSRTELDAGYWGVSNFELRSSSALHLAFRRSCHDT